MRNLRRRSALLVLLVLLPHALPHSALVVVLPRWPAELPEAVLVVMASIVQVLLSSMAHDVVLLLLLLLLASSLLSRSLLRAPK